MNYWNELKFEWSTERYYSVKKEFKCQLKYEEMKEITKFKGQLENIETSQSQVRFRFKLTQWKQCKRQCK